MACGCGKSVTNFSIQDLAFFLALKEVTLDGELTDLSLSMPCSGRLLFRQPRAFLVRNLLKTCDIFTSFLLKKNIIWVIFTFKICIYGSKYILYTKNVKFCDAGLIFSESVLLEFVQWKNSWRYMECAANSILINRLFLNKECILWKY